MKWKRNRNLLYAKRNCKHAEIEKSHYEAENY